MDNHGRFNKRLESITSDIYLKISKTDELKGMWIGGMKLSPQTLGRLKQSALITSTGASTRIEGSGLSDEEIEKVIKGIKIQNFRNRDEQEVKGYFELLENVFNNFNTLTFNENCIKSFHNELLKYVEKDQSHKGEYKNLPNHVELIDEPNNIVEVIFETTPPYLVSHQMHSLVEWTQNALLAKKYHPLLVIGNFIVEFLKIHPFQDGNGRLSRILTSFLLLKEGYKYAEYSSHEKLIEENKQEYYLSLMKSQKTFNKKMENILPWMNFFIDIMIKQAQYAVDFGSNDNIESLLTKIQLKVWEYISKVGEASPKDISQNTDIGRDTLRQVLNKLIKLKKVEKLGQGVGTYYRIIKD